jgi:hypothetical protein
VGEFMKKPEDLLGYCGFYCGDCLGYRGVIAEAAGNLLDVLERYDFRRTAECVFPQDLRSYDNLCEMLRFMRGLRCPGSCRENRESRPRTGCEVRACCEENGYYSCHECDDFETCARLTSLHQGLHADSCRKNLRAIREMGLETWLAEGKKHHYWDEADR